MRGLKKGTGRKLTPSNHVKRMWDDCVELQALQQSDVTLDVWQLWEQVLQTFMTGQTANVSKLCDHEWCEWMEFCKLAALFPSDKMLLGKCFGPSLETGLAMMNKSGCQLTFVICQFIHSWFEKRQKSQSLPPFCV